MNYKHIHWSYASKLYDDPNKVYIKLKYAKCKDIMICFDTINCEICYMDIRHKSILIK